MNSRSRELITLLMVDDTPANLVALKALLGESPDYRLVAAASGAEALTVLLHEHVDIILLDVVMPEMDGFEVARQIKAVNRTRHIPILFLTAVATQASYVYRAYDVGAVDYIVKPLDPEMVRKKVAVFADLVRQRHENERFAREQRETQRREYELQLSELRIAGDRRYRKLVEGIDHAITWTTDESLRLTFISRQASQLLGCPADYFLQPDFWTKHVHPDDREAVLTLFRRALVEGSDLVCNHRLVAPGGRVLWLHTGLSGERGDGSALPELHGFSVDVSDLKQAEEEARAAKQARDDLLATVSHDLRIPLTTMKLSAGMIGRALAQSDVARASRLATTIIHAAERMETLIEQLLQLAQLEAKGLPIQRRKVEAAALCDSALEILGPASLAKKIRLESHCSAGLAVSVDCDRIIQVVSNIVGNAIKFTPEGGSITIRAERTDSEVLFSIADTGPGIASEELPRIWNRFWKAKSDGSGFGLGLAIAKAIIEVHGGRIWAESKIGAGTTFYFTLRAADGDAVDDQRSATSQG
jgi:PAS domain S-box-containing protein